MKCFTCQGLTKLICEWNQFSRTKSFFYFNGKQTILHSGVNQIKWTKAVALNWLDLNEHGDCADSWVASIELSQSQ